VVYDHPGAVNAQTATALAFAAQSKRCEWRPTVIKQFDSARCVAIAALSLALATSCSKGPPDPKDELTGELKGANVSGYAFALAETEDQKTSSLTNSAISKLVTLGNEDATVPLRYTRVENKKDKSTNVYKTEVLKKGDTLTFAVTDLAGKVIDQRAIPPAGPNCEPPGQFDSLAACIEEFDCTKKGALQCQANRTCEPQFAALTCCLKNGTAFSVHLVIPPTKFTRVCLLKDLVPDTEGFVLSRR
jgi:hypothetical protein